MKMLTVEMISIRIIVVGDRDEWREKEREIGRKKE